MTLKPISYNKAVEILNQRLYLSQSEKFLEVGPVEMAQLLNTPYNTYKAWKSGRNKIPGVARIAIDLLIKTS